MNDTATTPNAQPSFFDLEHVKDFLLHGSEDISASCALEKRQNLFTVPHFCAPLYGLRHPEILAHDAYMSFIKYAAHTGTMKEGRWCTGDAPVIRRYREAALPRTYASSPQAARVLIGTSIAPKRLEAQQQAIATWTAQGFNVISVNYPEEIEQIASVFPTVRFVEAQRDSLPVLGKRRIRLDDFMEQLQAAGSGYEVLGIVNSDVGLYQIDVETLLEACNCCCFVVSHRIDMPLKQPHTVGYDVFFFPSGQGIGSMGLENYFIGEPWWDYALPLHLGMSGLQWRQSSPPCCFHVEHPLQWSQDNWDRLGVSFAGIFKAAIRYGVYDSSSGTVEDVLDGQLTHHTLEGLANLFIYMSRQVPSVNLLPDRPEVMVEKGKAFSEPHQYVTYFDKNYLAKGLALITSLLQQDPGAHIRVVCLDDETFTLLLRLGLSGVEPLPLAVFEKYDPELVARRTGRTTAESYWTLTPTLILRCLELLPENSVVTYVDADMFFFSSPAPLFLELGKGSVLIHKHNFSATSRHLEAYGLYNVGLMMFRNSAEGRRILHWWRGKCLEWCKDIIEDDPDGGTRYGDQKYLECFEKLSAEVRICAHPGAGVAPWNHTSFRLTRSGDIPHVNGQPTIFYHYHSFVFMTPDCAMPNAKSYLYTLDVMRLFVVPYFTALRKAFEALLRIQPDFNHGFRTNTLDEGLCVVFCKELERDVAEAFPVRIPLEDGYMLGAARQLVEYEQLAYASRTQRRGRSLEQALASYRRFPAKPRLLNLGCGRHFHPDWLNIDISPTHPAVYDMDLRKFWPLPSDFFDMVYHSHVLEHMSQNEGARFLHQCFTVLKPGGLIRIAVPDLERIARQYLATLDEATQGVEGAEDRYTWMLLELVDQTSRHHSGGAMAEFFKQSPLPEKDFVLSRIGREGQQLMAAMAGQPPRVEEESDPANVGAFRLGGEVHRWMYDAFSLGKAFETAGFEKIRLMEATESAWPNFTAFELDADTNGTTRKPDSLFMEAKKATVAGEQRTIGKSLTHAGQNTLPPFDCPEGYWNGEFPDWKSACDAADGYNSEIIFKKVLNVSLAVRDNRAAWERDTVLFYHQEYYNFIVGHFMKIAKEHKNELHVLDFGGSLGSTYMQNRTAFDRLHKLTWNIVEQKHVVECGITEFANENLRFFYSVEEAFSNTSINAILLSGVLQYLESPYVLLRKLAKTGVPIFITRTPVLENAEYITIQVVPPSIYEASYPIRFLNKRYLNGILNQHGYTVLPWVQGQVDAKPFCDTAAFRSSEYSTG